MKKKKIFWWKAEVFKLGGGGGGRDTKNYLGGFIFNSPPVCCNWLQVIEKRK